MLGFTLYAKGKDCFFETEKIRKTKSLAKEVIRALNETGDFDIPDNASGIDAVLSSLKMANCEIKTLADGRGMYTISGDGFNTVGIVGDKTTLIIRKR